MILHSVVYVANLSIVQVCDSRRHKACNQLALDPIDWTVQYSRR